jgi:hypothetical protein
MTKRMRKRNKTIRARRRGAHEEGKDKKKDKKNILIYPTEQQILCRSGTIRKFISVRPTASHYIFYYPD